MYSYELDKHFQEVNYFFNSFHDFEQIRSTSPQIRYNLSDVIDDVIKLHVFTTDDYSWDIYIKKERRS